MKIIGTFVLGMPGETQATLDESIGMMEDLADLPGIYNVSANAIVPYHGTRFYNEFLRTEIGASYQDRDLYDIYEAQGDFARAMTSVSMEQIQEAASRINSMGGKYGIIFDI
jgi:radical SAM superfamily enzyme YgiQ (UPF0313 family)